VSPYFVASLLYLRNRECLGAGRGRKRILLIGPIKPEH